MRNRKHDPYGLISSLKIAGQILIAIGTPFLYSLKLIFLFAVVIGKIFLNFLGALDTITYQGIAKFTGLLSSLKRKGAVGQKNFSKKILSKVSVLKMPPLPKLRIRPIPLPKIPFPVVNPTHLLLLLIILLFVFRVYTFFISLPDPATLASRDISVTSKIFDRNGNLLYQFYKDENRTIVNLASLPPYVSQATIAIEDRNFYRHHGFDPVGIVRAAFANSQGEIVQGGSTITQQLIRSAFLNHERSLDRKIKELVLAVWTELIYDKKTILKMYLNEIPYGSEAYGIEAASQYYFGKHAKELDLAQSALLAGLVSAPTAYSPFGSQPELSKIRQRQTLKNMLDQGYISKNEYTAAINEPLQFAPLETEIKAPHFVQFVKDYLVQKYGLKTVERGGLQVTTTLDLPTYETVSQIVKDGVTAQKYLQVGNGAALVSNPKTGEILAMVGSIDYFDVKNDGNVNLTTAERSPGSSIKPLNYVLAFDTGLITPATLLEDKPVIFNIPGQPPYSPSNYDGRFHGNVSARVALASSYNIPAIKVLQKNGLANFISFAQKAGITTFTDPSRYGLSLTLGGGEIKMSDMVAAYSLFPNQGKKVPLKSILKVRDYHGRILEDNTSAKPSFENRQLVSPESAFFINSILSDDSARAPAFGFGSNLVIPGHTIAVKTGTTETKRDNWTIGYSFGPNPRLVAVWVGNNDNSPMSPYLESGNTGAAAIWNPIMRAVLTDQKNSDLPKPENLVSVSVCNLTGTLACDNCPNNRLEYFTRGTEPKTACNLTPEQVDKILHPENPDQKH